MNDDDEISLLQTRIRQAIDLIGGSVAEMSRRSDVPATTIQSYLSAQRSEPGVLKLAKMARAAGVPLEWLATGQGEMLPGQKTAETLVNTYREEIDTVRFGVVYAAVEAVFNELKSAAAPEFRGEASALIYESLRYIEGEAEFRGGLMGQVNRLRRELREK